MSEPDLLKLAEDCLGSQFNKERWENYIKDEPEKAKKQLLDLAAFKKMPLLSLEPVESTKPKKVKK